MFGIPGKEIFAQLKLDLIGKDSHRGVTLTYAWLANQFGHFSLGFIPTLLVYLALQRWTQWEQSAFWAALIISGVWLAFEIYNFLGPLIGHRSPKRHTVFMGGPRYTFKPRWGFIAFDTSTDVFFFVLGSFACASVLDPVWLNIGIAIAVQVVLLYPIAYWFTSKIYLMNTGFPTQFRLSQWDRNITEDDALAVDAYLKSDKPQHLLIFGSRGTGKSSLAIGVASDLSTQQKRKKCTYSTGVKLYTHFYQDEFDAPFLWDWSNCDCLVIDDINPGLPMTNDLVTPTDLFNFIDHPTHGDRNKQILRSKKVVWVLGENHQNHQAHVKNWEDLVKKIGVKESHIAIVDLTKA
jgi:hypothetical protein